ncbi:MAG: Hpt domain-containing protein [Gemmatimonadota bacterium]|nr:Hpt domain-containing protein [Gemmatimonadota bacterium]
MEADRSSGAAGADALPLEFPDPVVVKVDGVIADLVPGYLQARRAEVLTLSAAVQTSDLAALQLAGHRLKGSGAGYGFPEITAFGGAIEDAASVGDMAGVVRAVRGLASYLDAVRLELP